MRIVLDANEYILALGPQPDAACRRVLDMVATPGGPHELCICRTIGEEVRANLSDRALVIFYRLLAVVRPVDEDWIMSLELRPKYEKAGLKAADARIAAYVEHVRADYLVSENRHFLSRREGMPFGVVSAEEFVRILGQ